MISGDAPPSRLRRLPSLDGLRGLSILLVLLGHAAATMPPLPPTPRLLHPLLLIAANAGLGVNFFFVISGYLITYLLLKELQGTGTISFFNFYLRRITRIFPAFYTFLAVISLLTLFGVINLRPADIVAAACFLWNYLPWTSGWWLGQTWSLSIEEQFYLLWPMTMFLLGPGRAAKLAIVLIVIEPLLRVASYHWWPSSRNHIPIMLHTRADILMFGCLLALIENDQAFINLTQRFLRPPAITAAAVFVFLLDPLLASRFHGGYLLTIGFTLQGAGIALIVLALMRYPQTRTGRLFNSPALRSIGLISYSLYLWQQVFLTPLNTTLSGAFPLNLMCAIAVAAVSYYSIEQPILRLRPRLSAFLVRKLPA